MDNLIIFLAKYLVWIVFGVAVVLIGLEVYKTRNWRLLGFVALAFLTAFLVNQILHLLPVEVYRPYQLTGETPLITPSKDSPFPSDHVTFAFTAAFAALIMTKHRKIGIALLIAAFGVLAGRILALVHSPLDVVGGFMCALSGVVWYYIYYRNSLKEVPSDVQELVARSKSDTKEK